MCMFSGAVERVASTRIFARRVAPTRQGLVYAMQFAAASEVAMILPIPTPVGVAEDAVAFVDLSGYGDFFAHLDALFPSDMVSRSLGFALQARAQSAPLKVVDVGAFEASFVPALAAFSRLDPRFRLDPQVWRALPQYEDHGFVVFKLRGAGRTQRAHPMAFTFPTRLEGRLFFPTVHVHDGQVHPFAGFDHQLYAQGAQGAAPGSLMSARELGRRGWWSRLWARAPAAQPFELTWVTSADAAGAEVDGARAQGLVEPGWPVARLSLQGSLRNEDVIVDERG